LDGITFSGKKKGRLLLRVQEEAECSDNLFMCSVIGKSLRMSLCVSITVGFIYLKVQGNKNQALWSL
jgi:hypothetical protein